MRACEAQQLACIRSLCYIKGHGSLTHSLCYLCFGHCFAFLLTFCLYMLQGICSKTRSKTYAPRHASRHAPRRVCPNCRSTGRAVFRAHLLAKQGRLVDVPQEMASNAITVEQLADYLEPILTVAAGGSLDAYRK